MLLPGYDPRKAAQAAAFFAMREGGKINVLKLSKLLYLAEREFMARYDAPMFYDRLVSMPDGPVASVTLNLINGDVKDENWSRYVAPRQQYDIALADKRINEKSLIDLSVADIEVLDSLWKKFGKYDQYELRDYTHKKGNIPEWIDPQGSSETIPHERVFACLRKSNSQDLADEVETFREFSKQISTA